MRHEGKPARYIGQAAVVSPEAPSETACGATFCHGEFAPDRRVLAERWRSAYWRLFVSNEPDGSRLVWVGRIGHSARLIGRLEQFAPGAIGAWIRRAQQPADEQLPVAYPNVDAAASAVVRYWLRAERGAREEER